MCKLIKEAKQLIKTMDKIDPIGTFHHRAIIKSCINEFKRGDIQAATLINETKEYKQQYLIN